MGQKKYLTTNELKEAIGDMNIPVYIQSIKGGICTLAKTAIYSDTLGDESDAENFKDGIIITVSEE